ncbi:MAG TPA: alpha/beta hydrolase [Eoetvoesiella sp.]
MAYWEWGHPDNDRVVICVHGLTRTGRDFDELAKRLSAHYRVVCPDIVGRGKSDWLLNPASYVIAQYVADILTLIARVRPVQLDWVGTSMGGLIGMGLAGAVAMSAAQRPPRGAFGLAEGQTVSFDKMVLNDIGPCLNTDGLARIAEYVGQKLEFNSFSQAVDYVRAVSAGFGPHSDAQWEQLTRYVFNQQGSHWVKHYDLRLAQPMVLQTEAITHASELLLWASYESIKSPILITRGELSDLLTAKSAKEMLSRNSQAKLVEFTAVGHAPTFMVDDQITVVEQFLLAK